MNQPSVLSDRSLAAEFRISTLVVHLAVLALFCGAARAQGAGVSKGAEASEIHVTHILGFESVANNTSGNLSVRGNDLEFQKGEDTPVRINIGSIQNVSVGETDKQVGGVPMTLGKAAAPFGGGRAVSLFSHKKYDTLSLEYLDANGGLHGAIFQLTKGQGQALTDELASRGAHVAPVTGESAKQSTTEAGSENK
jgi:hypothetical protein